jgi:hypothetical protein
MINWKIVAVFPAFAVIISILAGGLGGAAIADIIVRTILWSILFAGIGIGVNYILNKYFPEILEIFESGESNIKEGTSEDKGFEAFIPEENPHELEEMKYERTQDDGDFARKGYDTGVEQFNEESDDASELAEIDEQIPDFTSQSAGLEDIASDDGKDLDFDDAMESKKSYEDEPNEKTHQPAGMSAKDEKNSGDDASLVFDDDGLDRLPDFGIQDDSISGPSSETIFESESSFSKPYKNPKAQSFEQDPHKTAKAIHTMIQRDKEG